MGGFRFNGCGVTDHFKLIKNLGVHSCPNCKKLTEFTLDESNQKIDVFWIPTLTLKTRYAVMCKKCKNGEFCSSQWAGYLMNQTSCPEIIFESAAKAKGWSIETGTFQGATLQQSAPIKQTQPVSQSASEQSKFVLQPAGTDGGNAMNFFKCAYCGVTQMREGNFCAYCGKPAPELPKQEAMTKKDEIIICPHCGNQQDIGGKFCFRCGEKLTVESITERKCPYCGANVKDGMLFCMECGTKVASF